MARALAVASLVLSCAPATPPVAAEAYEGQPPLNPTLDDGRLVYRAFGDHHPECFAFVNEPAGEVETVRCIGDAVRRLESCPGGRLFERRTGGSCICVPIDGDAFEAGCPE